MDYPPEIKALFARYENNSLYVDTPEDWYPFVLKCHEELVAIDPDYTIFQIKEKFRGLRYYFTPSNPDKNYEMLQVTLKWEKEVRKHEQSKRLN
jgi:hypothetical protein